MKSYNFLAQSEREPTFRQMAVIMSDAKLTVAVAGPGSGKTQTMAWRIQRLMEDGVPAHRIVCITFTNNAAEELAARIGTRVGYCGTLHGYVLRLLKEHGGLIGLTPNITVLDEDEASEFRTQCLRDLKLKVSKKEFDAAIQKGTKPSTADNLGLAVAGYFQRLHRSGTLDYDAILVMGVKLVRELTTRNISLGHHLFVDEVQDSGEHDMAIYRMAPFNHKTMVGDVDQSIFGWRGGKPSLFLSMTKVTGVNVVALEENFRSSAVICETAQRLIEHNTERFAKQTIAARDVPGAVNVRAFEIAAMESRWICSDISTMVELQEQVDYPIVHSEIAVLCRTNHLVREMTESLQAQGIPVAERRFSNVVDISKARLLLSLLANPHNDYVAYRWLQTVDGEASARAAKKMALDAMKPIVFTAKIGVLFDGLGDIPRLMRHHGISEGAIALVETTIQHLPADSSVHDLSLALAQNWAIGEVTRSGVFVSTIHGAKGKEFDVVYMPAFEEAIIPGTRQSVNIEEERRLAYVGVTRARMKLVITHCAKRVPAYGPRVPEPATPSRYLAEMCSAS